MTYRVGVGDVAHEDHHENCDEERASHLGLAQVLVVLLELDLQLLQLPVGGLGLGTHVDLALLLLFYFLLKSFYVLGESFILGLAVYHEPRDA